MKPEDVPQDYFDDMMKLVPKGAKFIRTFIPKSYSPLFRSWWREFEFELTESIPNDWNERKPHKVGDRISFSCPLKLDLHGIKKHDPLL